MNNTVVEDYNNRPLLDYLHGIAYNMINLTVDDRTVFFFLMK